MTVVVSLIALLAVYLASAAMLKQGRITPGGQRLLLGIFAATFALTLVLYLINRSGS